MNIAVATTPAPAPQSQSLIMLPSAGTLLKEAIGFYRAHAGVIFGIAAVPALLTLIAELLSEQAPGPLIALVGIIVMFASIAGRLALMEAVAENGSPQGGVTGSYQKGVHLILPFIWLSLLGGIATMGGFYLFIIPGIFLSLLLSFAVYTLIGENKRGIAALVASWQYVQGYWWPVFWRFLFFGIVIVLLIIFVGIIFGVATAPLHERGGIGVGTQQSTPFSGIFQGIVANFIVLPLSIIYAFSLYRALKQAKANSVPPAEETERLRKRITLFIGIGIVGTIIVFALLGALVVQYLPEIQDMLKNIETRTGAPNAFPQTPLTTAAGFVPFLQSLPWNQ